MPVTLSLKRGRFRITIQSYLRHDNFMAFRLPIWSDIVVLGNFCQPLYLFHPFCSQFTPGSILRKTFLIFCLIVLPLDWMNVYYHHKIWCQWQRTSYYSLSPTHTHTHYIHMGYSEFCAGLILHENMHSNFNIWILIQASTNFSMLSHEKRKQLSRSMFYALHFASCYEQFSHIYASSHSSTYTTRHTHTV